MNQALRCTARRTLILVAVLCLASAATAQEAGSDEGAERPPGLAAFGVTAGFPAYRTAALSVSLQQQFFGIALRGSWTPWAGPYASATVRGYPPLPLPVPTYLAAGAGASRAGAVPHVAAGAHVPLARRWRADVEAGAAWTPLLDERRVTPYLTIGVSYAMAVDVEPVPEHAMIGPGFEGLGGGAACEAESPPKPETLDGAVAGAVQEFLDDARATYGSVYTDLSYDYEIVSRELRGDDATARVRYSGSVRPIAGGSRESASGTASASFAWTGCSWRRTGVSY